MQTKIRRKAAAPAPPVTEERTRRELARASSEMFRYRDPVYHVTEEFCQTFDRIGQKHARELAGAESERLEPSAQDANVAETETGGRRESGRGTEKTFPNTNIPLQTFSEMAFRRGTLSASVLRGTGKMMLVSCVRRTVGQSGPKSAQQRSVLDVGSQTRNVPGHDPDQMLFARGVTRSAVGLVVDTLRDARRVVQSMEDMANGTGDLRGSVEGATLRAAYPFLDDSRERELLEEYSAQLSRSADGRVRGILQNAIVRADALIAKKAQMKLEFINRLRLISDRAAETLAELEARDAVDEIVREVLEPEEEEPLPPPPEPPDEPKANGADAEDGDGPDDTDNPIGPEAADGPGTDGEDAGSRPQYI